MRLASLSSFLDPSPLTTYLIGGIASNNTKYHPVSKSQSHVASSKGLNPALVGLTQRQVSDIGAVLPEVTDMAIKEYNSGHTVFSIQNDINQALGLAMNGKPDDAVAYANARISQA